MSSTMPISTVRILLLGDSSVGKTALSSRYVDNAYSMHTGFTVGIDYKVATVTVDDKQVKIQIWDTAGQERFISFAAPFYRSAHGVVFVYDLTNPTSFANISVWLENFRKNTAAEGYHLVIPKVLVANKLDLSAQRSVSHTSGKMLAQAHNMLHFESSAKLNLNVSEAFVALIKEVLEQFPYEATPVEEAPVLRQIPSSSEDERIADKGTQFERRSNFRESKIYKGLSAAVSTLAGKRKSSATAEKKHLSCFNGCVCLMKRKQDAKDNSEN